MDRLEEVTWMDEAVLGDEGKGQCVSCGRVRPIDRMIYVGTVGKRAWGCLNCDEKDDTSILVKFLDERARLPRRSHKSDCGFDLFVSEETICAPGEFTDVPCGIAVHLPEGHWGHIVGRSSAIRSLGLMIIPAVIDQGYTGRLFTGCWGLRDEPVVVREGERIAQLIISPMIIPGLEMVEELPTTDRGEKGFGSSGR